MDSNKYIIRPPAFENNFKKIFELFCVIPLARLKYYFINTVCPRKSLHHISSMTLDNPKGTFDKNHMEVYQLIYDNTSIGRDKLEKKAYKLIGIMIIFLPLFISAFAYLINKSALTRNEQAWSIFFEIVAILILFLSFIGLFRAISIREKTVPFINSFIDSEKDEILAFETDRMTRNYIVCSLFNQSINDQIADLIKGGQYFFMLSLLFFLVAGAPGYNKLTFKQNTQKIAGKISIASAEIETSLKMIERRIAAVNDLLTMWQKKESQIETIKSELNDLIKLINALNNRIDGIDDKSVIANIYIKIEKLEKDVQRLKKIKSKR